MPDGEPTTRQTYDDVFVQAVKDNLDGTPHAHHPVQFEPVTSSMVMCTLCFAAVPEDHTAEHRRCHDIHNREHNRIMGEAAKYKPEPRYR